ncbi:MAG: hypothetical protein IJ690_02140, partial [Clostridia bacterium]|nr:hypothetical protein [Clostridia bacterium]
VWLSDNNATTFTLGTNDSQVVSSASATPAVIATGTSGEGVDVNAGTFNFYDGVVKGANNKSINGDVTGKPSGYEVQKTTSTVNQVTTETAILVPKLITNGALTTLNAKYNTGTWNGTHDSSATTWTALSGANGTKTAGTWGDNYLHVSGKSVNLGQMNPSPSETIQVTFSVDALGSIDQWIISNSKSSGSTAYGGGIYIDKTEYKIKGRITVSDGTTTSVKYPSSEVVVEPGVVYDAALTYDGTTAKIYVNGVSRTYNYNIAIRQPIDTTEMVIGSLPSGAASSLFAGNVYSVAVYDRVLTADEILHNAKAGFTTAGEDISTLGTAAATSSTQSLQTSSGKSLMSFAKSKVLSLNVDNSTSQETEDNSNTDALTKEETITMETPKVAQISGTDYSTISEAIMAANSGDTIKVLEDLNLTEEVAIELGKDIIINLNGKTITSTSNNTINNKGTLTIQGNGIIKNEVENGVVIYNTGILNIENGVITTAANGGKAVFNDNSDGTFGDTDKKSQDFRKSFIKKSNESKGSFNMKGGKIVTEGIGSIGIYNVNNSVSVITGGIIETRNYASKGIYNDSTLGIANAKVIISDEDSIGIYNASAAESCIIKESEITVEAEEIEDYELIKNTDQFKEELEKMKSSYGIYNDSDSEVLIETATIKVERLKGVGILNNAKGTITLGYDESIDDENIELNTASPIVYAIADNTTAIINSKEGTINFYDGKVLTTSSIKNIPTSVLKNYEIYEELSSNIISTALRLIEENFGDTDKKSQETENSSESTDVVNGETNSDVEDKSTKEAKFTEVSTPSQNAESSEQNTSDQKNSSSEESNVKPEESTESAENGDKSASDNGSVETDDAKETTEQSSDESKGDEN